MTGLRKKLFGVIFLCVLNIPTSCSGAYCTDPGLIANGHRRLIKDGYGYEGICCPAGTSIIYGCHGRKRIEGREVIRCTDDGTWTHSPPKCEEYPCRRFDPGDNIHVDIFQRTNHTTFPEGTVIHFRCESGYHMRGLSSLLCLATGWFGQPPKCKQHSCSRFHPGPHLHVDKFDETKVTTFPHETAITFFCDDGYRLQGISVSKCEYGLWLGGVPTCEVFQTCPEPSLEFGHYIGDCCFLTSTVTFFCNGDGTEFYLQGARSATCLPTGVWSEPIPTCKRQGCSRFETDPHLYVNEFRLTNDRVFRDGTIITYGCEAHYVLSGPSSSICSEGVWLGRTQTCERQTCSRFETEPHLYVNEFQVTNASVFYEGTIITYGCETGYVLFGPRSSLCTQGVWLGREQKCLAQACTRFETEPHLYVNEFQATDATVFYEGAIITYGCETDYMLFGPRSSLCTHGVWLGRQQKCEEVQCGLPETPPNGYMTATNSKAVGAKANFRCDNGYVLVGSAERLCLEDGQWDGTPARCLHRALIGAASRVLCPDPVTPDHGFLSTQGHFVPGHMIAFGCNQGYYRRGDYTLECLPNGTWSYTPPICISRYYFDKTEAVCEKIDGILKYKQHPFEHEFALLIFDNLSTVGTDNFRHVISLAKAITKKLFKTSGRYLFGILAVGRNTTIVVDPMEPTSLNITLERLDQIPYTYGTPASTIIQFLGQVGTHRGWSRIHIRRGLCPVFALLYGAGRPYGRLSSSPRRLLLLDKVEMLSVGIRGDSEYAGLRRVRQVTSAEHKFWMRDYDAMKLLAESITHG